MKIKSKQVAKFTVCLLLAVSVFACSFSVFAVDSSPMPTINPYVTIQEDMVAYYIYLGLKAWGIEVQLSDVLGFTEEVGNTLFQWAIEYVRTATDLGNIALWYVDWLVGTDYWGNVVMDSNMTEDIEDFANWIIDTFDLVDDSQTIVQNEGYEIGAYKLTPLPFECSSYSSYWNTTYKTTGFVNRGSYSAYIVYSTNVGYILLSTSEEVVRKRYQEIKNSTVNLQRDTDYTLTQNSGTYNGLTFSPQHLYYAIVGFDVDMRNATSWYPERPSEYSGSGLVDAINTATQIQHKLGVSFITGTITLPADSGYTDGDSMTIVDEQPDYSLVDWDGDVNVTNYPTIISPNAPQNPEIDQIYTNVPAFVETANDSMSVMKQIIFRMPDEVLITLYALLAVGVIFGFLRIMREH